MPGAKPFEVGMTVEQAATPKDGVRRLSCAVRLDTLTP